MSKTPTDDKNPLRKYLLKHGNAYEFRTPDHFPDTDLIVRYHRGYVQLIHPSQGEFYITRNAWLKLLRFSLPIVRHMDEQFSVVKATKKYLRAEKAHDRALRAQKKAAHQAQVRDRKRRRRLQQS